MAANKQRKRLVLASSSPRRAQLLRDAGYAFSVARPTLAERDELLSRRTRIDAARIAEALSFFKARDVAENHADAIILGADTVVSQGTAVFGKPTDADDARHILTALMQRPHRVLTGIALLDADADRRIVRRLIAHDVTTVRMRKMTDDQMDKYIGSGLWKGKAGAYGVQDHDDQFVETIEGSFTNVVGLPLELLDRLLQQWADDTKDH